MRVRHTTMVATALLIVSLALLPSLARAAGSYIGQFSQVSQLSTTVPSNGDLNPYGMFVVGQTVGNLTRGNILISNFNNSQPAGVGQQGRGTTIVQVTPAGQMSLFAQIDATKLPGSCPGGVGLTTALVVLQEGWVIVGSLPTSDGTSATMQAGCLIVLDSTGNPVETFSGAPINGPWDMTVKDNDLHPALFFTNVLNGGVAGTTNVVDAGTVVRMNLNVSEGQMPQLQSMTVIGSSFPEQASSSALVVGPTGLGLHNGTLYVADSLNNRIAALSQVLQTTVSEGRGMTVSSGGNLNDPLGLTIAPNNHILTVNGNDGNIVETTPRGSQIDTKAVDTTPVPGSANGAGSLFGLAVVPNGTGVYFVDDISNTLNLLY